MVWVHMKWFTVKCGEILSTNINVGQWLCPGFKPNLNWSVRPWSRACLTAEPLRCLSLSHDHRLYRQNQAEFHSTLCFSRRRLQPARRGDTCWRPCLSLSVWLHMAHAHATEWESRHPPLWKKSQAVTQRCHKLTENKWSYLNFKDVQQPWGTLCRTTEALERRAFGKN